MFDASCASDAASLNDCVYSGPNLLSNIFDILPRFRFNFIAILADSKQAFLNVEISKEHEQNKIIKKVPFNDVPKKTGQVHYLPH